MQTTTHYELNKPENSDRALIGDLNTNADIIDAKLYELETGKAEADDEAEDRAALIELVDGGAKNYFDISSTPTNSNATTTVDLSTGKVSVTSSGAWARSAIPVSLPAGNYIFSTTITLPSGGCRIQFNTAPDGTGSGIGTSALNPTESGEYTAAITLTENKSFYVMLYNNPSASGDTRTVVYNKLMLCTKAAWDISHAYQPYRPSEDEQNAQIALNKTNILSLYTQGVKNIAKPNTISATSGITIVQNLGHYEISGTTGGSQYTAYLCTPTEDIIATDKLYIPAAATRTNVSYLCHWKNTRDESQYSIIGTGLIIPQGCKIHAIYMQVAANTTFSLNVDMMICKKAIYDADNSYQPYAMTNAEITAAIQALQAQLANQ